MTPSTWSLLTSPRHQCVSPGDSRQVPCGEPNRCRLGEGTLPLTEMISAFVEAGYEGDFDVELLGEDVESADYEQTVLHSKRVFAELLDGLSVSH